MSPKNRLRISFVGLPIKRLSLADLGLGDGNQTHIGLLKDSFVGWDEPNILPALVYYLGDGYPCRAFTDPIRNPDGTLRSPKLRRGKDDELGAEQSALLIIRSLAAPGDGLVIARDNENFGFLIIPSSELNRSGKLEVTRRDAERWTALGEPYPSGKHFGFDYRQDPSDAVGMAMEGESETILARRRKRNVELRDAYVSKFGYRCGACGVLLSEVYGEAAKDLIEVHHLRPLSQRLEGAAVTKLEDLVGLCPNCHSVAHRRSPVYSTAEIRDFILKNGKWPKLKR